MLDLINKKVFVVDDEELVLKSITRTLSNLDFSDVTPFTSGRDCINHLDENPFLVLLDYQLDDMTGFDVLQKIKRHNPNIYVVMLSSQRDVTNAVETLKYGAFDYIAKGDRDIDKIKNALERIQLMETDMLMPKRGLFTRLFNLA